MDDKGGVMAYTNTEIIDAALEKFGFLITDFGFKAVVKDAKGTYLSQIVFQTNYLEIFIGIWGQGNEFWFTFTPISLIDVPSFEISELLNGITKDKKYFHRNIKEKTKWPVCSHTFPEYFGYCSIELRKHCGQIFAGDLSIWSHIAYQVLLHRIEERLSLQHRSKLGLTEKEQSNLESLMNYVKSNLPDVSFEKIEKDVLDRLTQN